MGDANNETQNLIGKIVIYLGGLIIGISSKLAELNQHKKLDVASFLLHTTVALACAWVVWFALVAYEHDDLAIWVSPIIGRFGDSIIFILYDILKTGVKNLSKKL